ncbi:MAG: CDGSH iron-sulfur domain-containing protein [Verrucomicrobiota bacterium]
MNTPNIAQKAPYPVTVQAGKTYYWCSCGNSKQQPFCDGSHRGSGFAPKPFTAEKDGSVYFCGCKHSQKGACCDGSHSKI